MFVPSGNQKHTGEDSFPLKLDTQKKDIQKKYGLVLDPIRLGLPFNGPQKKKIGAPDQESWLVIVHFLEEFAQAGLQLMFVHDQWLHHHLLIPLCPFDGRLAKPRTESNS